MNFRSPIFYIIISTVIILIAGVFVISSTSQNAPKVKANENSKIYVVDPTSYDWGQIAYKGGVVTKDFKIKNNGSDTLKIFNIKTSCHCTKANLTINGNVSPNFGMDGVSSWVGEVKPGDEAKLTVIFDPAFHGPQGIGPITRFVSFETNDSGNSKVTFTLTGTVVNK